MTRARLRGLALVLLAALTLRVGLAAPALAVAELRAVSHCVAHEGRPVRTADAARCASDPVSSFGPRPAATAAGQPSTACGPSARVRGDRE